MVFSLNSCKCQILKVLKNYQAVFDEVFHKYYQFIMLCLKSIIIPVNAGQNSILEFKQRTEIPSGWQSVVPSLLAQQPEAAVGAVVPDRQTRDRSFEEKPFCFYLTPRFIHPHFARSSPHSFSHSDFGFIAPFVVVSLVCVALSLTLAGSRNCLRLSLAHNQSNLHAYAYR